MCVPLGGLGTMPEAVAPDTAIEGKRIEYPKIEEIIALERSAQGPQVSKPAATWVKTSDKLLEELARPRGVEPLTPRSVVCKTPPSSKTPYRLFRL
jgi:hypothetical protein